MAALYIGTSGYTYKDWRGKFYPHGVAQKNWLTFYAQHYNAVEINATFYRFFPQSVFARWYEITPDAFRFVLKAPKVITHEKALVQVDDELQQFVSSLEGLQEKLAAVLWQFPANAQANTLKTDLIAFLPKLPRTVKHVFEFRHVSWFTDDVYALLNQFDAGFVINDSPAFASREVITDHLMYIRFHGPGKLYNSSYSTEQLQRWTANIKQQPGANDIYLFFNNTFAGQGLDNANELRQLLAE